MADKFIEVPSNLEDITILKRFLNELVDKLNSNALVSYPISYPSGYTGPVPYNYSTLVGQYTNTILEAAERADTISSDAKNYITGNLTTNVLQNTKDLATITEQFGTFYDDATAAAWYGLTVKSGELISGFTVSGVDSDTTTPGTAGSVFAISADTFTVGKAIEDISDPSELAYIIANGLPYGTMYDSINEEIIPAFVIDWNGLGYDIFFNGKTEFNSYLTPGTTTIDGGHISTDSIWVGGSVESSDFSMVGGTGFRLKSNANGTYNDPTIYGAYIRGAYLSGSFADISSMKIAATGFPDNYGKSHYVNTLYHDGSTYSTTTTLNTFLIYGPAYGTGLNPKRVCDTTQTIIELSVTFARPGSSSYIAIQRSVDGGAYTTVATSSTGYNVPFTYYFIDTLLPSSFSTCQYSYTIYTGSGNVVLWTSRITIDNI